MMCLKKQSLEISVKKLVYTGSKLIPQNPIKTYHINNTIITQSSQRYYCNQHYMLFDI